jgi:nicotinamide-nucleotide amidase
LVAQLLGKELREDAAVLAHIRHFFESRRRPMPERTRVQAQVPEGATVLPNPHGTAPGLAMEVRPNPFRAAGPPSWLIMLPGPPRELRPMFTDAVAPLLGRVLPLASSFVCRTLRTTGVGESVVQERIGGPLQRWVEAGLDLGYCARPGQVDVRLAARGGAAERQVREAEAVVRGLLSRRIYGVEDEDLETVIVRLLTQRKATLALAESCTGGCIAHRVTNVPGASVVLLAGVVTYSNAAKQKFLGVHAETLARHGAVSEPVAREMAEGARQQTQADYALSVTGIAGPSGGTPDKPVGTVFIGLAGPTGTVIERNLNPYDRETFKQVSAQQALELLRRTLLSSGATAAGTAGAA